MFSICPPMEYRNTNSIINRPLMFYEIFCIVGKICQLVRKICLDLLLKCLCFVEVKARRSDLFGNPKWALTPKKQRKISMVALYYLKAKKQSNVKARFDVVSISSTEDKPKVEIIKNAFELAYG